MDRASGMVSRVTGEGPLRVLCISHSAISKTHGRMRYHPLLNRDDLRLDLVMPNRWSERGRWLPLDLPEPDEPWVHAMPIRWAEAGPATWHLHHYVGLKQMFRRLRPEVIHLWQEPWSLVTYQTMRLRNRICPDVPLVLEVDQNIRKRLPPPFERIRRTVLQQTSVVLGRSDEAIKVVQDCGYAGPWGRIGYGVDQTIFHPTDRAAGRAELGISGFTVGYVGRLIEEKGITDLLQGLAGAKTPCNVAIMGEGPYRETLLQQASSLGILDRVQIMPWGSPHDVARFMGSVDVLALLTRTTRTVREQFGRVIIEAHACGTPVIGSSCGAIPEVVGQGGWIVPERSPDKVSDLLDRLTRFPGELEAARQVAQEQVAALYSFDNAANALASAWWSVAARGRTEPGGRQL